MNILPADVNAGRTKDRANGSGTRGPLACPSKYVPGYLGMMMRQVPHPSASRRRKLGVFSRDEPPEQKLRIMVRICKGCQW